MEKIILIKYGELTTKKANRNLFINKLYDNIKNSLQSYDVKISKDRVRMFIETEDNLEEIVNILKNIFGIHQIVICHKVNTNIDDIKAKALEIANNINFLTFKVVTKRSNKNFSYSSMEFNNVIGGLLLKNIPNIKVDVHQPDFLLKIEIRDTYTYIYDQEIPGIGGYPVSVAGKGLLMLSGGIDSPVAGYMAMKRGIKIECLYFESPPHTSLQAKNKVKELVRKLNKYQANIKLHIINFTQIQEEIYKNMNPNYMITIMRRMMYRISEEVARKEKCLAIINGESISQVASQTLNSMQVINNVTNYPIIRPLACFDKLEIISLAKEIDTYETSILPYEDCCTIFLPKHPVINPSLEKTKIMEEKIDYNLFIQEAINNMETIIINNEQTFDI